MPLLGLFYIKTAHTKKISSNERKPLTKATTKKKAEFYGNECVRNGRNKIFLNEQKQWQTAADYSP